MKPLKLVSVLVAIGFHSFSLLAQTEADPTNFFVPNFRSQAGSESAFWNDSFTNAYNGVNQAAVFASGGNVVANASVTQTTSGAFIAGPPGGGDIYSFSSTNTFVLNYQVSHPATFQNGIGGLAFQVETAGTEVDYSSVSLVYSNCTGLQTVCVPRTEIYRSTGSGSFGTFSDVVSLWQWPGLPQGVTNFTIIFNGAGSSLALERVVFDVTPQAAVAGPFAVEAAAPNIARWMYAFNAKPSNRPTAPTFGALGDTGDFDSRDGQYLLEWNTANQVPTGQGARNYLLRKVRVTLTLSSDLAYPYDGTLHDYRTYFPTNDPRHLPASSTYPVELYGTGFRGGVTNAAGSFISYNAFNYPQAGPFGADSNGGGPYGAFSNRVAYAACYDTNGLLVDVSNNVGDDGTNEIANPFEVAPFAVGTSTDVQPGQPMPAGSKLTFDVNLADPLIYGYVQQGLNSGNLSFVASSLLAANFFSGSPNYPDFYTIFNVLADTNQFPQLTVEGTVVRSCLDSDSDGLPDDWETFYFGALGAGANNTSGGDGVSNLAKYISGSNPSNTNTTLREISIRRNGGGTEIQFAHAPSRQYSIQFSDDLKHWQPLTNASVSYSSAWLAKTGTNLVYPTPTYAVGHDTNSTAGARFYRISVQ